LPGFPEVEFGSQQRLCKLLLCAPFMRGKAHRLLRLSNRLAASSQAAEGDAREPVRPLFLRADTAGSARCPQCFLALIESEQGSGAEAPRLDVFGVGREYCGEFGLSIGVPLEVAERRGLLQHGQVRVGDSFAHSNRRRRR